MDNPLRSKRAEWLITLPSFLWLALFFAVPALIVLAFTFHGHDASGGVGTWSMSTWRELVDPDYPAIVWNTLRISFEVTLWCIILALPCAYAIARDKAAFSFLSGPGTDHLERQRLRLVASGRRLHGGVC